MKQAALPIRHFKIIVLLGIFLLPLSLVPARGQNEKVLQVGISGNPPFVFADSENTGGIARETWSSIATNQDLKYHAIRYNSVSDGLKALENGGIDMLVGPVSITSERVERFDFSQPYYYSGLSIMSRQDDLSLWDRISPMFSKKMLFAVLIFLSILGLVGTLLWLAERKKSPDQFPHDAAHGIANGMWLAIVTMSTTGYGDKAPITFWGRVLAGSWMVISIIFATTMVAGIASTLTLTGMGSSSITEASQLQGIKVAAPSEEVASGFLHEFHGIAVNTVNLSEAYQLLKDKKVDAIVFDRPQLLYFKTMHPAEDIMVSRAVYDPKGYGFAFPLNSPLVKAININMLAMKESGKMQRIIKSWLGEKQ